MPGSSRSFLALVLLFSTGTSWADDGKPRPPGLRLGDAARPVRYDLRMRVVPSEPTFSGVIDIELVLTKPSPVVWMHGSNLKLGAASFTAGGRTLPARPIVGGEDFLGFAADAPLPAGAARLHVEYSGTASLKDDRGLFAQKENGNWYAMTQLEAIAARRVFPCFDEPRFKVPWQLTIEAPRDAVVLSNTAPIAEREEHPGMKTVTFAPTPPLPSYLVALAVGPFDLVDAGRAGKNRIPLRVAAPAGRAADAAFVARESGAIVDALEEYFGTPFPYAKLDQVSVPQPTSFLAMENPAMVTWAQNAIVARPEDTSLGFKRQFIDVAAHEFAHQWFGDLVTLSWWDDVWLNESFASWLSGRVVDRMHPEWAHGTHPVEIRTTAMAADSLVTARKIRQPIVTNDDIYNGFDLGITYNKGEAVLGMFERFLGEEVFQRAIRKYIADHANGNATAVDFFAALGSAAGRDLAPAISTFVDQPGVPLVHAELACAAGKPPVLAVTQERYVRLGSTGATPQLWQIPFCARWSLGGKVGRGCTLVTEASARVPLGDAPGCPDWVLANDQEAGYYRVTYAGDLLSRLLGAAKPLDLAETVGVLDDIKALVENGTLAVGEALALLPGLAGDPRRQVVEKIVAIAGNIRDLVPAKLRPRYVSFIQKLFGARARALGFEPKDGEDEDTRLTRPVVLRIVAEDGEDRELRARAVALSKRWLTDRKAIAPELVDVVLSSAALAGDKALYDAFLAEARRAPERRDRTRLLNTLARFRDPRLARAALDLTVSKEFDARESSAMIFTQAGRGATRPLAWAFVKKNFGILSERWAPEALAFLPYVGAGFCDEPHKAEVAAFFKDRSPKIPGGPRILAQATEVLGQCMAYRKAHASSAERFLVSF